MLRTRVIPALLLKDAALVKTVRFGKHQYIGDPVNTCRIFNELEVDELCFLDIMASIDGRKPDIRFLREISVECFMPLSYGGGIDDIAIAEEIFAIGFEKVVLNSAALTKPGLITEIAAKFGSQAVVVAIDVRKHFLGKYEVFAKHGTENHKKSPSEWAIRCEELGAGEILLTNIDREGTWKGFDIDLIKTVTKAVRIPVIAHGGAGKVEDIGRAVKDGGASAVALGSMVVFQKKDMGVLVNFPDQRMLSEVLI